MSKEAKFTTDIKFYNSPEDGYCHLELVDKDRKIFYDVLDNEVYDVKDNCILKLGKRRIEYLSQRLVIEVRNISEKWIKILV